MGRTNQDTATVTPVTVPITGTPPEAIYVQNESGDTDLFIRVPFVHGSTDFDKILPGDTGIYHNRGPDRVQSYIHKTLSGTAAFNQGIEIGGTDKDTA